MLIKCEIFKCAKIFNSIFVPHKRKIIKLISVYLKTHLNTNVFYDNIIKLSHELVF